MALLCGVALSGTPSSTVSGTPVVWCGTVSGTPVWCGTVSGTPVWCGTEWHCECHSCGVVWHCVVSSDYDNCGRTTTPLALGGGGAGSKISDRVAAGRSQICIIIGATINVPTTNNTTCRKNGGGNDVVLDKQKIIVIASSSTTTKPNHDKKKRWLVDPRLGACFCRRSSCCPSIQ